ncbi:MAG: deoxyribonuclease IV [Firmicutes bacterium]|nr:deoxyribonuclease IV [Bacillota bacterium]
MLKIGCHLSVAAGYEAAAKTAVEIGANTFQFFSRNPRGGAARSVDTADIAKFLRLAQQHDLLPVLAHAPYVLNASSATPATRAFAHMCMQGDLSTLQLLPNNLYTFHPGSSSGVGKPQGIAYVTELLNRAVTPEINTTVLLEAMSGKGGELGADFGELAEIISGVECADKIGVCLDTCHVFCAGYDIVENLDGVIEEFDRTVGLARLKAVHVNDSMHPLGSRKDRHAKIGEGLIGADAIIRLINHPRLKHLPFYLETPNENDGYQKEIAFLKAHYSG